jgi:MerR family redox-sensitive transcriptional activator SoxR
LRVGGRRIYDEEVFERLALIFLAQAAGFTIVETKELLHGFEPAATASERWRAIGKQKIAELTQRTIGRGALTTFKIRGICIE